MVALDGYVGACGVLVVFTTEACNSKCSFGSAGTSIIEMVINSKLERLSNALVHSDT